MGDRYVRIVLCMVALLALSVPVFGADGAVESEADRLRKRVLAIRKRVDEYEAGLPKEERVGPGRLAGAKLAVRKAVGALNQGGWWGIEPVIAAAERAVGALDAAPEQRGPRIGFQERAYVSEIDGSAEPYLLYVPTAYDEAREWPLLIFLHGYHPSLSADNWRDLMYSPTLQKLCEREGVILLLPYGRSNTEFMGIGESDVLRTLEYVRKEYRVDRRRIFISGASMGGSGAYSIACHRPDLFAGVAGITGRVDYYFWMKIPRDALPRFKQVQMDTDYARELLPNLAHVPMRIYHGEQDYVLPVRQSRLMHKLLKDLDQPCEYVEFRGTGHYGIWGMSFEHPSFTKMLRTERAPERPEAFTFRTFTLKYSSAYWLKIDALDHWGAMAEVRADASQPNAIALECKNVAAMTLGPGIPNVTNAKAARITVNGKVVKPEGADGGRVRIRLRPAVKGATLRKTPSLSGPIREVYDGPFLIVYPAADTAATGGDRRNAQRLAMEWVAYSQGRVRLRPDHRVSEEDIAAHNLILCGSPATNQVLARIADKLPVRIEKDKYVVGMRRFPRAGSGLQVIFPNPLNPQRYVLIVHGVRWGPELQPNHKLDFLPDFIVYAADTVDDKTMFPTNRTLCAGYFDGNWRLSEASTWVNTPGRPPRIPDAPPGDDAR